MHFENTFFFKKKNHYKTFGKTCEKVSFQSKHLDNVGLKCYFG